MFEIKETLTFEDISEIITQKKKISLSDSVKKQVQTSFDFVQNKINNTNELIYGINTGFGSLCNTRIEAKDLQNLQYNLLRSHACGTGNYVPKEIIKLMLLLKVQSLSYGYSGVNLTTIERLIDFFNLDILPVVYEQGSLGASGDLAPLSHLCLPLLAEGFVWQNNQIVESSTVLNHFGLKPIELSAKEGLALINGTQFMSAYGVDVVLKSRQILSQLSKISALSIDAFDASLDPFYLPIHQIRKQNGQLKIAEDILELLKDSEISKKTKQQVQDPYSFRCIPQVHGASLDALQYIETVVLNEINSVTDNPNIFVEENRIVSGGNFHGQPLAITFDFAAIAISELANISERRIYKLISGERALPPFLTSFAGVESGMMIAQYTAAGIVSQNKQLCTPASVDSIVSSNGQEDHVSMGANAATKLYQVVQNTQQVLAIEMLIASKAIQYRRPLKTSAVIETFLEQFKQQLQLPEHDCFLSPFLIHSKNILFN